MSQCIIREPRHSQVALLSFVLAMLFSTDVSAQASVEPVDWGDPVGVEKTVKAGAAVYLGSGIPTVGDALKQKLIDPLLPLPIGPGGQTIAPVGVTPETVYPSSVERDPFTETYSISSTPPAHTATTTLSQMNQAFVDLAKDVSTFDPSLAAQSAISQQSQPTPVSIAPQFAGQNTFSSSDPTPKFPAPGGVSLSFAAAAGLVLDIGLDGFRYKDGMLIVSGKSGNGYALDLALFTTALRLACSSTPDPYFSLDPDDGAAWNHESRKASEELSARIDSDFPLGGVPPKRFRSHVISAGKLRIWTISAKRDYPRLWQGLHARYPNLKARLVFKPDWLRETRLGEILYVADVLLKELTDGTPMLSEHDPVRAAAVARYRSVKTRTTARGLLAALRSGKASTSTEWRGYRMWFDFAPSLADLDLKPRPAIPELTSARPLSPAAKRLESLLRTSGFDRIHADMPFSYQRKPSLPVLTEERGTTTDLTGVFPQMFVRRHDHAVGKDVDGDDPDYNALAADVNQRLEDYAAHYRELRDLIAVFRAYTAAVALVRADRDACAPVTANPSLLEAEKVSSALPTHHPSELTATVGDYQYVDGSRRNIRRMGVRSVSGGISLRGDSFYSRYIRSGTPTSITRSIDDGVAAGRADQLTWNGTDGRHLVRLDLKSDVPLPDPGSAKPKGLEAVFTKQLDALAQRERRTAEKAVQLAAAARERLARRQAEETVERLTRLYGPPADETTRRRLAPIALAASEAKAARVGDHAQALAWRALLRKMSYSVARLDRLERLRFSASIRPTQAGLIIIAYGTPSPTAWIAGSPATAMAEHDLLARAATDVAWATRIRFSGKPLVLTGAGAGGDLAAIAGEQAGLHHVITFNANPHSRSRSGPGQIDVAVVRR